MDTIHVKHSENRRRRLSRLRRVLVGAGKGIQQSIDNGAVRHRVAFGTATYAKDDEWGPRHISELMRHYRRWCKRRGIEFKCIWVAELTKRGRLHYHWVMWLPYGITPPKPDKQGWWSHGSTNVKWARKPIGYLLKYASKEKFIDHDFPKGARLFAASGPTGPLGYFRAPSWMKRFCRPGDDVRLKSGFWNNHTTGIGYRSPWMYAGCTVDGIILEWVGWGPYDYQFCNSSQAAA